MMILVKIVLILLIALLVVILSAILILYWKFRGVEKWIRVSMLDMIKDVLLGIFKKNKK
jgi:hypothetical protein